MKAIENKGAQECGATAVEYALIIGFVSLATVAAAVVLGGGFVTWVSALADAIGTLLS